MNAFETYLIPLLILVPLGAAAAIFLAGTKAKAMVPLGVVASFATLLLSALLVNQVSSKVVPVGSTGVVPRITFAPEAFRFSLPVSSGNYGLDWQFVFGADGISALLVLLTGLVSFFTLILALRQIDSKQPQYIALLLVATSMLMGVFLAMDLISFYVFFEAVLLPLILLINGWGNGSEPMVASRKFLLFTLAGSIPMVIGLIALALSPVNPGVGALSRPSTISIVELSQYAAAAAAAGTVPIAGSHATWILWLLLLGFGIKLAILPLHSWLPTTYAAAHPNTTALIAAVVAKLGLYGLVRIVLPLAPATLAGQAQLLFGGLGALAIVYGALVALSQTDMRKVLAYSSLSHVGFITVGLMSMTEEGIAGATLQMFNHGLITASMFWILAMLEQRRGSIDFALENQGLAALYPKLGVFLVFFVLAGAGLPGLNGFVGEYLALSGMMRVSGTIVAVSALGTLFGAWYGLRIVQRLLFGGEAPADHHASSHAHGHAHHLVHSQHASSHGHSGRGHANGKEHATSTYGAPKPGDLVPLEWVPLAAVALTCLLIGIFPQRKMELFLKDTHRVAKITEPNSKSSHPKMDTLAVAIASSRADSAP